MAPEPAKKRPLVEGRSLLAPQHRSLPGLFVICVRPAPATVLLQFKPLASIALALGRNVIAPLALLASQRQRGSLIRSHFEVSRFLLEGP